MIKKILLFTLAIIFIILITIAFKSQQNQNQNINQLLQQELDGKLIPHKVNYINKLNNVLDDNLLSFEFDTIFNIQNSTPYFEIGHDKKELQGVSFEDYLKILKGKKIKKIWMDIKHVKESNIPAILNRLNYLDKIYKIKNILIFESNSISPKIKLISDAGYHTSYYLPIDRLIMITKNDNILALKEATKIKEQINYQNLKAVSFPTYIYSFIKTNIEPIISDKIVYHTWDRYKFKKKDELIKIQKEDFFKDERVKTIIYSYDNNKFNRLYSF